MALSSPLSTWLLANADRLNLQASRFDWVDDWLPGLFDFAIEMTVDGELYEGRGSADTEDLAFAKAGAEALERAAMRLTTARSSNGFAVHTNFAEAAKLATAELIERDAYFCHWVTRTPFLSLDAGDTSVGSRSVSEIVVRLAGLGIKMTHAQLNSANGTTAIICIARGTKAERPFGLVQGLGCGSNMQDALAKSTVECLRTVAAWQAGSYRGGEPLTAADFAAIQRPGSLEHERLGLHPAWVGLASGEMQGAGAYPSACTVTSIRCDQVALPESVADAPIVVVRATSPDLQDAVFGHLQPSDINLKRLSTFCGRDVSLNELCLDPHCFG